MQSLRNQFIMAPLKLGYCNGDGFVNNRHIQFYNRRSRDVGAITLEPLYLDPTLREIPNQLGIDQDDKMPGLQTLVHSIHQNNAQAIAHLNHPGRMANPQIAGNKWLSSTDQPCENGGATPIAMDEEAMHQVIELFTAAVRRADSVGFDAIELQMGHGYLLAQFISPAVNTRSDAYGGDFSQRIQFPLMVFDAIKKRTNLPVIVRISGDEMISNGIHLDEMVQLATILEKRGAAALHISAGTACSTPPWFFQHMFVPKGKTWNLAASIQQTVQIPVIFVGQINTREDIQLLQTQYQAPYIAIGRALVADPDFIAKIIGTNNKLIRPCLACSDGCLGGVRSGKGLGCLMNPDVGTNLPESKPAKVKKRMAVVGAGPAGSEAALTLSERGHQVTLYEKNTIGGQFTLAALPPKKSSLNKLVQYYQNAIARSDIKYISREATESDCQNYDEVIIASGAVAAVPPIPGLQDYIWADVLKDENIPSQKNIAIIGGGLIGIEVAHKLTENQNSVVIIELLDEIARGMEMIERTLTLKQLTHTGTRIYTGAKVTKVDGHTIYFTCKSSEHILENIDLIVLAAGMKAYLPFPINPSDNKLHIIGDARQPGKAQAAIYEGRQVGISL